MSVLSSSSNVRFYCLRSLHFWRWRWVTMWWPCCWSRRVLFVWHKFVSEWLQSTTSSSMYAPQKIECESCVLENCAWKFWTKEIMFNSPHLSSPMWASAEYVLIFVVSECLQMSIFFRNTDWKDFSNRTGIYTEISLWSWQLYRMNCRFAELVTRRSWEYNPARNTRVSRYTVRKIWITCDSLCSGCVISIAVEKVLLVAVSFRTKLATQSQLIREKRLHICMHCAE